MEISCRGCPSRSDRRRGATLVEILVVVAILGALLAVLVPGVQAAREAARRLQCGLNLRQVGLAVLGHHEARRRLPTTVSSGVVGADETFDPRGGSSHSWLVQVLPYLEEQPLFSRFDLRKTLFAFPPAAGDAGPQAARLAILVCPSDGAAGPPFRHPTLTADLPCGRGNYAAWASPFHVDEQHSHPGVLAWRERPRLQDVSDGLHATLMATEVRSGDEPGDARGTWAVGWNAASVLAFDMHPFSHGRRPFRHSVMSLGHTQRPNLRDPAVNIDMLYACPAAEKARARGMPCATWRPLGEWNFLSSAPRSLHPGGVQSLWADGRVTFLEDGIDEILMGYLIAIDDGRGTRLAEP